jgi:hypothetical protein
VTQLPPRGALRTASLLHGTQHSAVALPSKRRSKAMRRKEMRATAYEKLMEATQLLASAGLPLLAEEVEELGLQVDLQGTD